MPYDPTSQLTAYSGKNAGEFFAEAFSSWTHPYFYSSGIDIHPTLLKAFEDLIPHRVPTNAEDAKFEWKEELHPRGKAGKFAKKGTASPKWVKILKQHGFTPHSSSEGEIYQHHSGEHHIAFQPAAEGTPYSSGAAHYIKFKPNVKITNAAQLAQVLQENNLTQKPSLATQKNAFVLSQAGAIPGKVSSGGNFYSYTLPNGKGVVISLNSDYWSITGVGHGYGEQELKQKLQEQQKEEPQVAGIPNSVMSSLTNAGFKLISNFSTGVKWFDNEGEKIETSIFPDNSWAMYKSGTKIGSGSSLPQLKDFLDSDKHKNPEQQQQSQQKQQAKTTSEAEKFFDNDATFWAKQGKDFLVNEQKATFVGYNNSTGNGLFKLPSGKSVSINAKSENGAWKLWGENGQPITSADSILALASTLSPPSKSNLGTPLKLSDLKQTGPQLGSQPGGQYEDSEGNKYYVKHSLDNDHAKNELLAARLYKLAGVKTLDYHPVDEGNGKEGIATKWETLPGEGLSAVLSNAKATSQAQKDFAIHAWLANWDAVGIDGANVGYDKDGNAVSLDLGGSLLYRAMGAPKGDLLFGNDANEWNTLRNSLINPKAAQLFGNMTSQQLFDSAKRLSAISNDQIQNLVKESGPGTEQEKAALAGKLIARKNSILQKASVMSSPSSSQSISVKTAPVDEFKPPFTSQNNDIGALAKSLRVGQPDPNYEQKKAIASYTGNGHKEMNADMRFGLHTPGGEIAELIGFLDNSKLPHEVTVNRKVSDDYAKFLMRNAKVGSEFTEFSFASTSINPHAWSGEVTMMVHIPKGSRAAYVNPWSSNAGDEREVLVQRGSIMRVVAMKGKTLYCELDQSHLDALEKQI